MQCPIFCHPCNTQVKRLPSLAERQAIDPALCRVVAVPSDETVVAGTTRRKGNTGVTVKTQSINGSFAHEVMGMRLWEPQSDDVVMTVRDLWARHGVLVFRRQSLSEQEYVDFCAWFGALEPPTRADWVSADHDKVVFVSNLRDFEGKEIGGLGSGEIDWHADQAYVPAPATGSFLYAAQTPKSGTPTYFANLRMAYADLSETTKMRIDTAEAVHSYAQRIATYVGKQPSEDEVRRRWPDVVHSLVHRDPVTGEGALYMDPLSMRAIIDWPQDEARRMLDDLLAHATQPQYVYRHAWQPGDLVMWDNGFMLHRRDPIGATHPRLLKRTTVVLPASRHIVPSGRLLEEARVL